jgi:serine phosphatase RsbU (regulator of sigma subunit)
LNKIWAKISNNGIPLELDENEKKRIRILNIILSIIIVLSLFFLIIDLYHQVYEGVAITLVTIFTCLCILFLIYKKKHTLSKWLSIVFIISYVSLLTVLTGKNTGTIIYLIPGVLFPTIIFHNKKTIIVLSTFIIGLFCTLFWLTQSIGPFIELTDEVKVIYRFSGMLGVIITSFLMIWYFRNLNDSYENIIVEKNESLITSNDKVNLQKLKLEIKNKEITDSINYARRIQQAILPPESKINNHLKNNFILYLPKDIVAGDFYWLEAKEDRVLFAAADCTGHGVPGAMVSVVCNNALNRSVREYDLTDPGKILDKTREIVIQEFEKSDEQVRDGMDIAICSLIGDKLEYAGAHNPLWIVRNGVLLETKAHKQPIGQFDNLRPYTTHSFVLEKGDTVYIFSDGYPDQFGGEKGKKYKTANFKKFLLTIQENSMEKQLILLSDEFKKWRGSMQQIDDVCVIGLRI